jgi:phosphonate transport system permease protein
MSAAADQRWAAIRELRRDRPRSRVVRWSASALTLLAIGAWLSGEIAVADLFSERRGANLARFLERDAMPLPLREDGFSWAAFSEWVAGVLAEHGWEALLATLGISVVAIVLATVMASVLAPLATRTLMTCDPYLVETKEKVSLCLAWRVVAWCARLLLIALRAIPEYVWAFLLLASIGSSAWPAILALAIHNSGILGRLGAETIENLPEPPLRALRALGASRRQLLVGAAFPVALPRLLLYFFYRFENCVREATVLGLLGVVSLGYWIQDARAHQRYDEMLLYVVLGAALVIGADVTSQFARAWVRRAR